MPADADRRREVDHEIDFVVGAPVEPDEDLPDTTGERRMQRRWVIGLIITALAIAAVVVVRASNGSTPAAPKRAASTATRRPSTVALVPSPIATPDRPDACPAGYECRPATTSGVDRADIMHALAAVLGRVRSLRIVTRVRSPRRTVTTPRLFTRLVNADTPYGPVVVYVYQAVTDGDAEFLPVAGRGQIVTLDAVARGYNVSIAIRVPPGRTPVSPRLTRLAADARLIALR